MEPNPNMPKSYLGMAEESIIALSNLGSSRIWTAAATYYAFYYSLYAVMLRMGFRCEIHSCSISFMRTYLTGYYNKDDIRMMRQAFDNRNDLQYYADRTVDEDRIAECKRYCKDFFIRTKDILIRMKEEDILKIRERFTQETR